MNEREALKLALEALDSKHDMTKAEWRVLQYRAFIAIKEALAQLDQESDDLTAAYLSGVYDGKNKYAAQPEQEPVAWMCSDFNLMHRGYSGFSPTRQGEWNIPVYTTPPQRKPLTEEQCITEMLNSGFERNSLGWSFTYGRLDYHLLKFARAIEAAHGIKGEA